MLNAACILLAVAVLCLASVCVNLTRRLRDLEAIFRTAAERLGAPQNE